MFVSTAQSRLTNRAIGQQEENYNLSYTELHCLRAHESTRERERTNRDGQRDGQTEIWTNRDGRTSLALKNSLVLNCGTQCLDSRGSVEGGGEVN